MSEGEATGPSCPRCRHKKKHCVRSSSGPPQPCKDCQQSVNMEVVPDLDFPEKANEVFFNDLENIAKPLNSKSVASEHLDIRLPYMRNSPSECPALWTTALDTAAHEILGVRLRTEFENSNVTTDPIEIASLIAGYLCFLISAGFKYKYIHPQGQVHGEAVAPTQPEIIVYTSLLPFLISRIRFLIENILLIARSKERPDAGLYAAEGILYSQLVAFRLSLKEGHILSAPRKPAPRKPATPLVCWFASLERHFLIRTAKFCGQFPAWLKKVHGPIHKLPHRYKPRFLALNWQQERGQEAQNICRPEGHEFADFVEGQDPVAVGPPFPSNNIATSTESSGQPEDTIVGAMGPVDLEHVHSDRYFQGFGQALNPTIDNSPYDWERHDTKVTQVPGSGIQNPDPSTVSLEEIAQLLGITDPTLPMVDMTDQPEAFDSKLLYQDSNNPFTPNQANKLPATANSMFSTSDTTNRTTFDEENFDGNFFDDAFLYIQGPSDPPFT